jgi:DNA-3-methyladenine glycosylase II
LRRRSDNIWDRWDGQTYRRVLVLRGEPTEIAVSQSGSPAKPKLNVTATGRRMAPELKSTLSETLRRMLGLQVDLREFYRLAMNQTRLKHLAQKFRGLKPTRYPTVFETLVNAITCQQFTLTSGIRMLNRLVTDYGVALQGQQNLAHAFPRPEDLAGLAMEPLRNLGFSQQKACALIELARMVTERRLNLENLASLDDAAALESLNQLRGVGRWTGEYVLLRGLGRVNIFPGDDVGVRNKLQRWLNLGKPLNYEGVGRILARWKPYGGLIYFHLLLNSLAEEGYVHNQANL